MSSTSVSLLEERLAARLWWQAADVHPAEYELDPEVRLLDGPFEDDDEGARPPDGPADGSAEGRPALPPEACLVGVRDQAALAWAALRPGVELVRAVEGLWADLAADLEASCRSTDVAAALEGADDGPAAQGSNRSEGSEGAESPQLGHDSRPPGSAVSDAELVEAVAACERQISALAAHRDLLAGVFATRRQSEAEADLAQARAASAADGKGRPWATRVRSTAPTELCARLGIGSSAGEAMVERGLAAVGCHRDVAAAMAAGALPAGAGTWLLEELSSVRTTSYLSALERESAAREQALADQRAGEDAARAAAGGPALTGEALKARAVADQAAVD
ncbi:hypothetical protein, partial [Quadrisphaera sp. KR29]|uniref:hypothetical protein n=1 Tax=Quadrisphaera sp. KR29 TaxID=3461391 RepID=UPI004043A262